MPEEKVVELSRSLGITPVGLFAAVFTRAARNVYGIEDYFDLDAIEQVE